MGTETVHSAVTGIYDEYGYRGSAYFPVMGKIAPETLLKTSFKQNICTRIKRGFINTDKKERYFGLLCCKMALADNEMNVILLNIAKHCEYKKQIRDKMSIFHSTSP